MCRWSASSCWWTTPTTAGGRKLWGAFLVCRNARAAILSGALALQCWGCGMGTCAAEYVGARIFLRVDRPRRVRGVLQSMPWPGRSARAWPVPRRLHRQAWVSGPGAARQPPPLLACVARPVQAGSFPGMAGPSVWRWHMLTDLSHQQHRPPTTQEGGGFTIVSLRARLAGGRCVERGASAHTPPPQHHDSAEAADGIRHQVRHDGACAALFVVWAPIPCRPPNPESTPHRPLAHSWTRPPAPSCLVAAATTTRK